MGSENGEAIDLLVASVHKCSEETCNSLAGVETRGGTVLGREARGAPLELKDHLRHVCTIERKSWASVVQLRSLRGRGVG